MVEVFQSMVGLWWRNQSYPRNISWVLRRATPMEIVSWCLFPIVIRSCTWWVSIPFEFGVPSAFRIGIGRSRGIRGMWCFLTKSSSIVEPVQPLSTRTFVEMIECVEGWWIWTGRVNWLPWPRINVAWGLVGTWIFEVRETYPFDKVEVLRIYKKSSPSQWFVPLPTGTLLFPALPLKHSWHRPLRPLELLYLFGG